MNSKLLAFNLAQDLPTSEIDATDAHYDAQEQVWVDQGAAVAATSCGNFTAYACASGYKVLTPNTDGYTANTDGYTPNTDGYSANTDGYTPNTDGYGRGGLGA